MLILSVGDIVPKPFLHHPPPKDGACFNLSDDGTPFISIYLHQMVQAEQDLINDAPIEARYFSVDGFWMGMLKFERMFQEITFDPMLHFKGYGSFCCRELFRHNRLVTIMGIESSSMEIKVMRAATYPWRFLESLYNTFEHFTPSSEYSKMYKEMVKTLHVHEISLLWGRFTPAGYFGESVLEAMG